MIVRIVRGRVATADEWTFHSLVRKSLPAVRAAEGCAGVWVAHQQGDGADAFVFVSVWQDLDSIYRWVACNDLLHVPSAEGGYSSLMLECDVQHYETFADVPLGGEAGAGGPVPGFGDAATPPAP